MIGLNGGSVEVFLHMVSMVLVSLGVDAILGNRYGIMLSKIMLHYFRGVKKQQGFNTGITF